jgi:membrane-bound lytic murein transglycosylase D
LPEGTADIVRQQLEQSDPTQLAPLNWHVVKRGETLQSIARALKVSRTDLAEANYRSTRARVAVGQRLIIPRAPTILLASNVDNPAPVAGTASPQPVAVVASAAAASDTPPVRDEKPSPVVYRVKRGDTLFSIARVYSTTVAAIKSWNKLRSNAIQIGQRLTIFPQQTAAN